ncbi:hypothetical protein Hanom_Chr09g00772761 [Helianthus anomalus]
MTDRRPAQGRCPSFSGSHTPILLFFTDILDDSHTHTSVHCFFFDDRSEKREAEEIEFKREKGRSEKMTATPSTVSLRLSTVVGGGGASR